VALVNCFFSTTLTGVKLVKLSFEFSKISVCAPLHKTLLAILKARADALKAYIIVVYVKFACLAYRIVRSCQSTLVGARKGIIAWTFWTLLQ
jgi:hypothetical protein